MSMPGNRPSLGSRLLGSVRLAGNDHRVTQFELFFDLVFVFAFTQVTGLMISGHDATSVVQALTVLGILWWAWVSYSWLANQAIADQGVLRAGLAVATGLMFVIAVTIPEAYQSRLAASVLIGCYFLVRVVHAVLYVIAAAGDRGLRRQVIFTIAVAALPAIGLMVLGAVIGGELQTWIWLGAWLWDVVAVYLTSRGGDWRLHSAAHWAERYGLVVLLAIGESVVSIGAGLRETELTGFSVSGALLAIAGAVILWWIYFHRFAAGAERALASHSGVRKVVDATIAYTYLHYLVVAGVILIAVGIEQTTAHIDDPAPLGWFGGAALAGGVSLYQAATVFVWFRMTGRWLLARLISSTLLLPGIALAAALPALGAIAAAVIVGVVLLTIETRTGALDIPAKTAASDR